jgi:hypothetical protein
MFPLKGGALTMWFLLFTCTSAAAVDNLQLLFAKPGVRGDNRTEFVHALPIGWILLSLQMYSTNFDEI